MINVSIDARPLIKDMDALAQRQLPYALMKTINATAEDFQAAQQENVARRFTLRRPTFVMNTIKIERQNFATKDNLRAIVGIDPSRDVLSKFEDQGQKTPMFSGHALAIPIEAKRNKQDIVQNSMRPKALHLTFDNKSIGPVGGIKFAKGIKGTFLIQKADGSGGIFQRQGPGRGGVHLLFKLMTKVPLPRTLTFVLTAKRVVAERMPINWERWLGEALRTAR